MRTIYISGTPGDMQAEKEAIRRISIPLINREAYRHGDEVSVFDFEPDSLSYTDSLQAYQKALPFMIRECQAPFVILLAERPGEIPEGLNESLSELEIRLGALENRKPCLVYLREMYSGHIAQEYDDVSEADRSRMRSLKEMLYSLENASVKTYTVNMENEDLSQKDIDAFARMFAEDIRSFYASEWEAEMRKNPFERMRERHWHTIEEKAKLPLICEEETGQCEALLKENRVTVITGKKGCEKNTVTARIAMKLKEEGRNVLPLIGGLGIETSDAWHTMTIIEQYLAAKCAQPLHYTETMNIKDHQDLIRNFAAAVSEPVYFLIDEYEQLYEDENRKNVIFIPEDLPENIHYLIALKEGTECIYEPSPVLCESDPFPMPCDPFGQKIFTYIAFSRHGFRMNDLKALMKAEWSPLRFAKLLSSETSLIQGSDGRYDFADPQMRKAIFEQTVDPKVIQKEIADHFASLAFEDPMRLSEYVYHLLQIKAYSSLHEYMAECFRRRNMVIFRKAAENVYDLCMKEGEGAVNAYMDHLLNYEQNICDFYFLINELKYCFDPSYEQSVLFCQLMERLYAILQEEMPFMQEEFRKASMEGICTNLCIYGSYANDPKTVSRYARELFRFAKEHFDPNNMNERIRLFNAYGRYVSSLKNAEDEDTLKLALKTGEEGLNLLRGPFEKQFLQTDRNALSMYYRSMKEIYTRLQRPVNAKEMAQKEASLQETADKYIASDRKRLLSAGGPINAMMNELKQKDPDKNKAFMYALKAVEIFDTTPITDFNEHQLLRWADVSYFNAAGLRREMVSPLPKEEEMQIIRWYLRAYTCDRRAYRKFKQDTDEKHMERVLMMVQKMGKLQKETCELLKSVIYAWINEDMIIIRQDPSLVNYQIFQRDNDLLNIGLSTEPSYREEVKRITAAMLRELEPKAAEYPQLQAAVRNCYFNLYRLNPETDDWQKAAAANAEKLKDQYPQFYKNTLEDIMNSYMNQKGMMSRLYGFYYTNELWKYMKDNLSENSHDYVVAAAAAINRAYFMSGMRKTDARLVSYVEDLEQFIAQYGNQMSQRDLEGFENLVQSQKELFSKAVPAEDVIMEEKMRNAIIAYSEETDPSRLAGELKTNSFWLPSVNEKLITDHNSAGNTVFEAFSDPVRLILYYYGKKKVLYMPKKTVLSDLNAFGDNDELIFDPDETGLVFSLKQVRALSDMKQISTTVTSFSQDIPLSSLPLAVEVLESMKDSKKLVYAKEDPVKVQEALRKFLPHLNQKDVIAYLDASKKSFFRSEENAVFFTGKALESSFGSHVEYDKTASVELKNRQLQFKYKTGFVITMNYDDPDGIIRDFFNRYLHRKNMN